MKAAIKEGIKKIFFSTLHYTKTDLLFEKVYSGIGTILCFHRVCPGSGRQRIIENSRLEVTPGFLEQCIEFFLKKDYEIVSMDAVHDLFTSRKKKNRRFVAFTFDDGYRDNLTDAYPIFKK